jgi:hypothetical protein
MEVIDAPRGFFLIMVAPINSSIGSCRVLWEQLLRYREREITTQQRQKSGVV